MSTSESVSYWRQRYASDALSSPIGLDGQARKEEGLEEESLISLCGLAVPAADNKYSAKTASAEWA